MTDPSVSFYFYSFDIISVIFSLTQFIPLSAIEVLKFYFLQTGLQFTQTSFNPLTITAFYITRNS
jgi:hypothetical protein